jgi:acyl dehydratase
MGSSPERSRGKYWDEFVAGTVLVTRGRTVTEADLVNFTAYMGFTESLFQDATYVAESTPYGRRIAPAALTLCLAEGLVIQSGLIDETGIALLEVHFQVRTPVFIGDTIHVEVQAAEARPTSRGNRGIVTTDNRVFKQDGELVLEYRPVRMIRGNPAREQMVTGAAGDG